MNPLEQYPGIRKALYIVQWLVTGVLGAIGVVLAIMGDSPMWFMIGNAVFNFIWTYTGLTASNNTHPEEG